MKIYEIYGLEQKAGEVGIEIEMESDDGFFPAPAGWKAHREGSLRGNGMEYVFAKPLARDKYKDYLDKLERELFVNRVTLLDSDRCGIHTHVNVQQLTFKQTLVYGCLYLILEEPLVRWCGDSRVGNFFCLRARDAEYLIDRLIQSHRDGNFNCIGRDTCRYASINFEAIPKFGSLEFRALPTTNFLKDGTQFSHAKVWTDVLLKIKDKSLAYPEPYNLVEALSFAGPVKFTQMILGDDFNRFEYKGMHDDIMESIRMVQDIAYANSVPTAPKRKFEKGNVKDRMARLPVKADGQTDWNLAGIGWRVDSNGLWFNAVNPERDPMEEWINVDKMGMRLRQQQRAAEVEAIDIPPQPPAQGVAPPPVRRRARRVDNDGPF